MCNAKIRALWCGEYYYFSNLIEFHEWVRSLKTHHYIGYEEV